MGLVDLVVQFGQVIPHLKALSLLISIISVLDLLCVLMNSITHQNCH